MRSGIGAVLLAAAVALLGPGAAWAFDDTITLNDGICGITTSGGAHTISDISGCDYTNDSAGDGVDNEDDFLQLEGASELRCLDDLTQGTGTGVGIYVATTTAYFNCDVMNHSGSPAAITLTLGAAGLDGVDGFRQRIAGGFRSFEDGSVMAEPDLDRPWYVGDPIPCPVQTSNTSGGADDFWEPDCSTNPGQWMTAWPDWKYDPGDEAQQGGDNTTIDESVAQVVTTAEHEDVMYMMTPGSGSEASGEEWFFYEIKSCSASDAILDNYCIIDIVQSDRDQPVSGDACDTGPQVTGNNIAGYTHAKRQIAQGVVTTDAVLKRGRTLRVASSIGTERTIVNCVASGEDYENVGGDYVGRWVRFAGSRGDDVCGDGDDEPCIMESLPYRIMRFTYDYLGGGSTDNRYVIGDVRGFRSGKAVGTSFTIGDYGFATGDPFLVIVPLRVQSATTATEDTDYHFGLTEAVGVVWDGLANFEAYQEFQTIDWRYTWFRDNAGGRDLFRINNDTPHDLDFSYVSNTPADSGRTDTSTNRNDHFMVINSTQGITIDLNAFSFRYYEDDQIANQRTPTPNMTINVNGARCQHSSNGGDSLGCFDMQGEATSYLNLDEVEFTEAGESEALNDFTTASRVMAWAQRATFLDEVVTPVSDFTVIGGDMFHPASALKFAADGFVVRDHYILNGQATWRLQTARNGYFADNVHQGVAMVGALGQGSPSKDGRVQNVAIIDQATWDQAGTGCDSQFGDDCTIFGVNDWSGSEEHELEQVSVVFTDDWEVRDHRLRASNPGVLTPRSGPSGGVGIQNYASGQVDDDADTGILVKDSLFAGLRGEDCQTGGTPQEGCIFTVWQWETNDVDTDGLQTPADKGMIYEGDICFGGHRRGPVNDATLGESAIAPRFNNDSQDEIRTEADLRRGVGVSFANGSAGQASVYMANGTVVGTGDCGVSAARPPGVLTKNKTHAMSRVEPEWLLAGSQAVGDGDCPAPGCPVP